jgi:hypothetical protein
VRDEQNNGARPVSFPANWKQKTENWSDRCDRREAQATVVCSDCVRRLFSCGYLECDKYLFGLQKAPELTEAFAFTNISYLSPYAQGVEQRVVGVGRRLKTKQGE